MIHCICFVCRSIEIANIISASTIQRKIQDTLEWHVRGTSVPRDNDNASNGDNGNNNNNNKED